MRPRHLTSCLALVLLLALFPASTRAQTSSPSATEAAAEITPSPSLSPLPEKPTRNLPPLLTPATPSTSLPHISPQEAEARLKMLQKELIQLNEKLQQAEEQLIGADPRLGELKRLMDEAKQRRAVADENWLGVYERYTSLHRQIRQKYDKELQEKVKALAEESERKFKQEWSEHEAKRREENRLMQQAAEKLTADLRAAIEKYKAALQKTDFFTSPSLNAVRERMMEIAREKAPLIMLLKPTARSLGRAPAATTAMPSPTPAPAP